MCGINAAYFPSGNGAQDRTELIRLLNDEMRYRGPDDEGIWSDGTATLGMVRLSIIGVDNGHQPLMNEESNIILVCNGEIYNFKALKSELIRKGHTFSSSSDCEVIVHLYEEIGEQCVKRLDGMFAFILWDQKQNKLLAARDRIGLKPLYYTNNGRQLVISSEFKSLLKYVVPNPTLNYPIMRHFMANSYPVVKDQTLEKDIFRIPAGHILEHDGQNLQIRPYWSLQVRPQAQTTPNEVRKKLLNLLKQSVLARLQSDVPVAVLLSGGIDSSAIACLAAESGQQINVICAGYEGKHDCDEREIAKKLCVERGFKWHEVELSVADYHEAFNEYLDVLDEPVGDVAAIAQWALYKKSEKLGFKVLLGGNGGDELFYGYPSHNITARRIDFAKLLRYKIRTKGRKATFADITFLRKNIRFLLDHMRHGEPPLIIEPFRDALDSLSFHWPEDHKYFSAIPQEDDFPPGMPRVQRLYRYLFDVWLPANCLFLADKLGMGNSVEVRAPFTDHHLVEYVYSLPVELHSLENGPKNLLKEVLRGIVPDYILDRPKRGFTPPAKHINEILSRYNPEFFTGDMDYYHQIVIDQLVARQFERQHLQKTKLRSSV